MQSNKTHPNLFPVDLFSSSYRSFFLCLRIPSFFFSGVTRGGVVGESSTLGKFMGKFWKEGGKEEREGRGKRGGKGKERRGKRGEWRGKEWKKANYKKGGGKLKMEGGNIWKFAEDLFLFLFSFFFSFFLFFFFFLACNFLKPLKFDHWNLFGEKCISRREMWLSPFWKDIPLAPLYINIYLYGGKFSNLARLWLHTLLRPCFSWLYDIKLSPWKCKQARNRGGGVRGVRRTPPNLPKGPLLARKWAKNGVFVGG